MEILKEQIASLNDRTEENEKNVRETKLVLTLEQVKRQWRRQEFATRTSNHDKQDDMAQNQSKVTVKRWRKKSPTRLVFMDQSF